MPIVSFMLHCNQSIAAMQTSLLWLASGIRKLTPDDKAELFRASPKGDPDVQDCFYRPRTPELPVRPPDRQHRPPVGGQRSRLHSQRRPAPLRALKPANSGQKSKSSGQYGRHSPTLLLLTIGPDL